MPMPDDDSSPISASDAKRLFADWKAAPALVLAVSGGPDSIALMWLAARWRRSVSRGPRLVAVTVDHDLREEAAREAREVKRLAHALDLEHRTMRWRGAKPQAGVPAAAPAARYQLLAQAPPRAVMRAAWRGWPGGSRAPMPRSKFLPMAQSAISRSGAAKHGLADTMRKPSQHFLRKSGFGCSSAPSTGTDMRDRRNLARSR